MKLPYFGSVPLDLSYMTNLCSHSITNNPTNVKRFIKQVEKRQMKTLTHSSYINMYKTIYNCDTSQANVLSCVQATTSTATDVDASTHQPCE